MIYFSEISLRHFWDFGTLYPTVSDFLLCLSVCQLAYFLTEIRQIQGYGQFMTRDISDFFETFLRYFHTSQPVCWLTSLLTGPSFGKLKAQRGLQDKPPCPVGSHYSSQATSPIISSTFARSENAQLYILVPSITNLLTYLLSPFLSPSSRKLETSVNIDGRTLMRDLSDFLWKHFWDFVTLVLNNSDFPVCLSLSLLAY